jgi:pimeloyl-ACP methyl ester carboxylesterase
MFANYRLTILLSMFCAILFCAGKTCYGQIVMKDGRILRGQHALLAQVDESAEDAEQATNRSRPIIVINDGLRRVFVSRFRMAEIINTAMEESLERFRIRRTASEIGKDQKRLLPFLSYHEYEPFDEFGRRIVIVNGDFPVEQTITEINPRYVVVASRDMSWDLRIATNSFPQSTITNILMKQINPKDLEDRKRIVRFYLQGERYMEAASELEAILNDFGGEERVLQELQAFQRSLGQLKAEQLRQELTLRHNSGQYEFVKPYLAEFPTDDARLETLQAVRNMIEEDAQYEQWRTRLLETLYGYVERVEEAALREAVPPILDEISAELTQNTMVRFSPLQLMLDDDAMPVEEKLAIAISGWLVGENEAMTSLPMAISMHKTRDNVRRYLVSDTDAEREAALQKIESEEAGTLEIITKILPVMKPVYAMTQQPVEGKPGYYQMQTPAFGNLSAFNYCVQLPPEYDPNRKYPLIISLHGEMTTPEQQTDWWAGNWREGRRTGHATRHGYIVMAPLWNVNGSSGYDYSAAAHAAVLYSYYDVLRHFSVDVDRVFLTGYSSGGDAAWDIGISHPDLWAGVMPIVASGRKYTRYYPLNARYVPLYFVTGELDASVNRNMNYYNFNRYLMAGNTENYQCTVVTYIGRGHESFSDEILHLIDWMGRQRRVFPNRNFAVHSLRPWDNFFWWVEGQFPASAMINPSDWPDTGGPTPNFGPRLEGNTNSRNRVQVKSTAAKTTIWLSPELVNFDERVEVQLNGRRTSASGLIEGKLVDLLEDVRTRHDRQHPFWLKITL